MRKHYESLNYLDCMAGSHSYTFSRTAGTNSGVLAPYGRFSNAQEVCVTRLQVKQLRDMLNEVLEDWQ